MVETGVDKTLVMVIVKAIADDFHEAIWRNACKKETVVAGRGV